MISYKKTFDLLEKREIPLYKIINDGPRQKALRENGYITTRTLDRLCAALDCQPGDLVEYIPDNNNNSNSCGT
ncbi:MAG: helix-turn-helix domain-containing protein [bacterium]|nr:helix-turn-helix domain-containing protein [bacterium]